MREIREKETSKTERGDIELPRQSEKQTEADRDGERVRKETSY